MLHTGKKRLFLMYDKSYTVYTIIWGKVLLLLVKVATWAAVVFQLQTNELTN